jgi:LuxR family transcriptional regulator, maltose regulon positive regulatory protein
MAGIQQASPEAVLTSLINDLDQTSTECALVLDDYQLINSQAVHEQVTFLLNHLPRSLHLVIATRSDPPLPFARLRARGQMVELRCADLRFTEPEAAQFLNNVMGLGLDPESIGALEERTEGWAAGLQMASLAMLGSQAAQQPKDVRAFIEGFSGTHRYILDYLLEEVLSNQPPETQRFLLYTSILERLTAPLCDALLATDAPSAQPVDTDPAQPALVTTGQSAAILKTLERDNLFLFPLDEARTWFRYHHLFADLLRIRLEQAHVGVVHQLQKCAAAWLEQNGFLVEAIQHLLAAQADHHAADLIEQYGPICWENGDPSIVQMTDSLPPEIRAARPKICLYQAWLLIIQGRIEAAIPLMNDIERQLAGAPPNSGHQWMRAIIGLALAFLSPRAGALAIDPLSNAQVLDTIPANEPILRDAAEILFGMALARRNEIDRAADVAIQCIQRKECTPGAYPQGMLNIPSLVPFLARVYWMQGRLHAAAALCQEYLAPMGQRGLHLNYSAGSMSIVLGEVLTEWNRLEAAERYIRDGLQANEYWQNIMTEAFGLTALVRVSAGQREACRGHADHRETRSKTARPGTSAGI